MPYTPNLFDQLIGPSWVKTQQEAAAREEYNKLIGPYVNGQPQNYATEGGMSMPGGLLTSYQPEATGFPGEAQAAPPAVSAPSGLIGPNDALPMGVFAKMAGIQGYEPIANTLASQAAAGVNQIKQLDWSKGNQSLTESLETARLREKDQRDREWRESTYNNMSAAEKAQVEVQRRQAATQEDRTALDRQRVDLERQRLAAEDARVRREAEQAKLERTYPALALKGKDLIEHQDKGALLDQAYGTVDDVIRYIDNPDTSKLHFTERARVEKDFQNTMLRYLQKKFNAQTMNEGEIKFYTKMAGRPLDLTSLSSKERAILSTWKEEIARDRANHYRSEGRLPPSIQPGSSSAARSRPFTTTEDRIPNLEDHKFNTTPGGAATGRGG